MRLNVVEFFLMSSSQSHESHCKKKGSAVFGKMKEIYRESQAMAAINAEFEAVCPDAAERKKIIDAFTEISKKVECPHNMSHVLTFVIEMMKYAKKHPDSDGVFVEAGCFKGGSTAKFSLVVQSLMKKLVVFDSFEGIPDNQEGHDKSIFGYSIKDWFKKGSFCGGLEEVQHNVAAYGDISVCSFVKGWFEETLPNVEYDIAGAYIDVDLASSTKTCIQYIYPRLSPGGFLVSQDGDFPLVIDVFTDDQFWEEEIGCKRPVIHGLNKSKMLVVYKED